MFTVAGEAAAPMEILMSIRWFHIQVNDQMSIVINGNFSIEEYHRCRRPIDGEFYGWMKIIDFI